MNFSTCLIAFTIFFLNLQGATIGISTALKYVGDREIAWRIKIAGESLGWNVFLDEENGKLQQNLDLDWVICMLPRNEFDNQNCPNYLTVFHPFDYLDENREFLPFYKKYDGYLLTINDRESLANSLDVGNEEFNFMPFFPSTHYTPYQQVAPKELVTMLPVWSNRLTDKKFQTLYKLLSKTKNVKFYGVNRTKKIIKNGYMGKIPFDGVSVLKVLQKHGITLILHSDIHNHEGIPSGRIFEASAASTIIISDENPFVKKHFGDSVFYIDTTQSAKSIFNQIQRHLYTISNDTEKALEMAKNAHEIFSEKFEMSKQLIRLQEMHEKLMHDKNQRKQQ